LWCFGGCLSHQKKSYPITPFSFDGTIPHLRGKVVSLFLVHARIMLTSWADTLTEMDFVSMIELWKSGSRLGFAAVFGSMSALSYAGGEIATERVAVVADHSQEVAVSDPLEPLNRLTYKLNDGLYVVVFRPIGKGIQAILPPAGRQHVANAFNNLGTPASAVNTLLQGRPSDAGTEIGRFAVNSTWGVLGLGDPAKTQLGWEPQSEDFGQTLGTYGVPGTPYVQLPVLGPSSPRDTVGAVVDFATAPFTNPVAAANPPMAVTIGMAVTENSNRVAQNMDSIENRRSQPDPYAVERDKAVVRREKQVRNERAEAQPVAQEEVRVVVEEPAPAKAKSSKAK
jgi:phospholipid-binding lipoprotein MlaA